MYIIYYPVFLMYILCIQVTGIEVYNIGTPNVILLCTRKKNN